MTLAAVTYPSSARQPAPQAGAPDAEKIAWLWDKAELPAWSSAHAAVLVDHIHLTGSDIRTRPRSDRPALTASTRVTPLVHVEVSIVNPPTSMEAARTPILQTMLRAAEHSTSGWVQLDMEARPSQRAFYRSLVADIRKSLPPQIRLSVTALAWWCRSPDWLDGLAADEVVPMLFRMGRDSQRLRQIWSSSPRQLHPACRQGAIGLAVQEPMPAEATVRYGRIYFFDARHWRD